MARWDPWSDLFDFQNELARLVSDRRYSQNLALLRTGVGGLTEAPLGKAPLPVDIRRSDSEYLVEASVTGFTREQVEVVADQGWLTITANQAEGDAGEYLHRERVARSLFRQLTLPSDVQADQITADLADGVLTVHIPRVAAPSPRRVAIGSGRRPDSVDAISGGSYDQQKSLAGSSVSS